MKWSLSVTSVFLICVAISLPVGAETFTGVLSGGAENPANNSPGTGPVEVELDPVQHELRIDVTFSGLESPSTIAHIHCCAPPGESAGVATMLPTFSGFPASVTSGTFQATLDTTMGSTFNQAFIDANGGTPAGAEAALLEGMNSGLAYFNIHTVMFGSGEIRADLTSVAPATPSATFAPGTPTSTALPPIPTATVTLPAGTATATITAVTPAGTATATAPATGTRTVVATASPTATSASGSPTITSSTRVGTATVTPSHGATGSPTGSPARTATRTASSNNEDDGCNVVAPEHRSFGGGMLTLLAPAALLILMRRRRS